ncbi:NAD(P)/FAD-dependent oxidoreductase [Streptomyces sp. NPDC005438]|uniref:NAD(P)/FAD-dependent oxidoreductase n=1 Tax=Streptomyces sp. NPDC005438 TaxID=3156880 RepID=UPI0033B53AA9
MGDATRTSDARELDAEVVIVGAGPAGLAAAHHLSDAGVTVRVLEREPVVGGRLRTHHLSGFLLDQGPGLFPLDWPELGRLDALRPLPLRPFDPGALVHWEGRRHRVGEPRRTPHTDSRLAARNALHAARALATARRRGGMTEVLDLARLRSVLTRLSATDPERLLSRAELPVRQSWLGRGLPSRTVEGLLAPLLTALLSDPTLTTSGRIADLVLRSFVRSGLALPEGGSEAVPRLLADALPPGTVRTGVTVRSVSTRQARTLEAGPVHCRAVLVATGAASAARLLPGLRVPDFHPVTVLHHATPRLEPRHAGSLCVDADQRGPVSHSWVASTVDPGRAPEGRGLVTSVVLGSAAGAPASELDRAARPQLAALHGVSTSDWELLAAHADTRALPAMPAPHDPNRAVRVLGGLYVCGDHRDSSTLQGSLRSGRRAALALLRDMGVRTGQVSLSTAA